MSASIRRRFVQAKFNHYEAGEKLLYEAATKLLSEMQAQDRRDGIKHAEGVPHKIRINQEVVAPLAFKERKHIEFERSSRCR